MIRKLAITIPEDMEEIDMHFAEQVGHPLDTFCKNSDVWL